MPKDYSSFGKREKKDGRTVQHLRILLKEVVQGEVDVFVHENVSDFPQEMLRENLPGLTAESM